jgi:hypothetical protein
MNYKKCIGLCLALLLLVSNIGLAFNVHYCGGKIASISIQTIASSNQPVKSCCAQKALKKDNCCKNKKFEIEKKSDNATLKAFSFEPYAAWVVSINKLPIVVESTTFVTKSIASYYCDANAPPLFKLYSQYVFYA